MGEDGLPGLCAAVVYGEGVNANAVLEDFARTLDAQGYRVLGLIQHRIAEGEPCAGDLILTDLAGNENFLISQRLGPGSQCCRLDPGGVADASRVLRDALADPPDLLLVNKFGKLETDGGGFLDEIMMAAALGVPVLTSVHERHLEQWRAFTGEYGTCLPPQAAAVSGWWRGVRANASRVERRAV